jgi:tetratricopeptide (TPR) repeat protein
MRHYGLTCDRGQAVAQAREAISTQNDSPASYVYLMMPDVVVYNSGEAINERWLESEPLSETFAVAKLLHRARLSGVGETLDESLDTDARRQELEQLERSLWGALELYPDNKELIAFLLTQATDRGDSSQVESLLKRVPASAADDGRFFRHKGWLHRNREELVAAEKAFRLAIEKDPYDWRCRHQLAEVLRLQGNLEGAEPELAIANLGAQLRKTILGLSTLETLPVQVLEQLREYAAAVGDERVVAQLAHRIALVKQVPDHTDSREQSLENKNQGA